MRLKVQTPVGLAVDTDGVRRMVVHSQAGAYGILPRRLDCVIPLVPGILAYEADEPRWVGIDAGVLVKAGAAVTIVTHLAFTGALAELREVVARELLARREADRRLGEALAALETHFMRGLVEVARVS